MSTPGGTAAPEATSPPRRATQRAERRGAILDATVRILTTAGLAAVTHRAVAREADVPLAATTYYFSSKEELIGEALSILVADEIERLTARAQELGEAIRSPAETASAVAEVLLPDAEAVGGLLAKFEVYVEAARTPGLRDHAARWQRAFAGLATSSLELAGAPDPARRGPLLVAAADGILLHALSDGVTGQGDVERLRELLEQLFALVLEAGTE